jgi:glycosyltransferase involved in cell wall biosynthesis
VAFCSERDRTLLRKALPAGVRTAVVPNAVDTATLRPLETPVKYAEALFLGGLTYGPNLEAAQFIVSEIAPRVATDDITVLIAGGQVSDLAAARAAQPAEQRCPNGARFLGKPADVRPAYKRSYATVAPLFSGSGTRLKVLESFAYGRPVVSTAKGVEGLAVEPNVHYLPAETAEQFATQLVALRDRDLWARLVAAGRLLVEQRYSWDVAGEAFLDLLDQSIGHR